MELDDALESAANARERDSIESIAVTKHINRNFSLSNVRVDIKNKRHPMPYDPANFSFSYSHSHRNTSGETTIYENDDQWRGALNYSYTPVYKTWEPFKQSKSKSKWMNFPKALGFNYLPQNISFNSEWVRTYYELQERDLENTENPSLPLTFSQQFLWNRDFQLRWDFTKNLHMTFQSATHAEIEEPYTPVNKDLYPDQYSAWKDSVWTSLKHWGTPLDYRQSFSLSYQVPLDKLPIFDWMKVDASFKSDYSWLRGTDLEDGTSLGNTISSNRNLNINGNINLETLYNHVPFLKKTNDRFKKQPAKSTAKSKTKNDSKSKNDSKAKGADSKDGADKAQAKENKELPKNKNTFQKEVTLLPDSQVVVQHGKKSKRLLVSARNEQGRKVEVKWKVVDENKIKVWGADSLKIKLSVTPKEPLDNQWWYNAAQHTAHVLMMVRSVNISYRNQASMTLPGFLPNIGDAFGQRTGSVLAPGLDFAFGFTGDSYIDKATDRGWLLCSDNVATPANTSTTEDLQLKATLEPLRDLKIDLNASRTVNKAKSIQFMYEGSPTTLSGNFNMTTISLSSALEGMGDANNGYKSSSFDEFCGKINAYRDRVQAQYAQSDGPAHSASALNSVDPYSADVLIPAFLDTYTWGAGGSLDIFPALTRLLPNWTVRYAGLSKLPWVRDHFKSVNLNHSYKSVYSIGSYASYSSWVEYMGDLGFVKAADGSYTPSSRYNISTVSINEAFSPLLGVDMTFNNNLTCKVEYRTTRVLNLSMTSVQINESQSKDWVIGMGYKFTDLNLFGGGSGGSRKVKGSKGKKEDDKTNNNNSKSQSTSKAKGVNHDLNTRLDISFRSQAAITRDIASGVSSASSGNSALKISLQADYTLSRMLTLTAYYDRQTNTPLLSSSSYPTTTQDFGVSLKFSLTR
jgi:cell surface protein SprA